MANDHNIKNYTAADIEKYHKGQLSSREMHELEKAAMDDPFLADALEGYSMQGVNVSEDIAELKKRLAEKTEQAKVIPIAASGKTSFPWLRAAIMVVLIAGGVTLAYQFLVNPNNDKTIAQSPKAEESEASGSANTTPGAPANKAINDSLSGKASGISTQAETETKKQQYRDVATDSKAGAQDRKDSLTANIASSNTDLAAVSPPVKSSAETDAVKKETNDDKGRIESDGKKAGLVLKDEAKNVTLNKPAARLEDKESDSFADLGYYKVAQGAVSKQKTNATFGATVFRGTVTDPTNTPLPFAKITNRRDAVGTYSDAQGKFTLVSGDSLLDVEVKSVGFENNNVRLRGNIGNNQVVMQEDRSLEAKVLDTVKHNISLSRAKRMTFEEPAEPEDGWPAYNSYVLNNLNLPDKMELRKQGQVGENTVEVSFEVSKTGDPVNIKVEKSLCDKCDKEAIRLIKDGPKWKRKGKKGKRTTVTVPFIKTD